MSDEQDGLGRSAPMQPYYEVLFVGKGAKHLNVFGRKSSVAKTCGHGFSRGGHVAGGRISGINLNEFLENITRDLVVWGKDVLRLLAGSRDRQQCNNAGKDENRFFHRA